MDGPESEQKKLVNAIETEVPRDDSQNYVQQPSCNKFHESIFSSRDDTMVATIDDDIEKIEPLKISIKLVKIVLTLFVDSGSACRFLDSSLSPRVVENNSEALCVREMDLPKLRLFLNEPMITKEKLPVLSNGWKARDAENTIVSDGLKSLIGRHLFAQLGLEVILLSSSQSKHINNITTHCPIRQQVASQLPNLSVVLEGEKSRS